MQQRAQSLGTRRRSKGDDKARKAAAGQAGEKKDDSSKRSGAGSEPAAKRTLGQQRALPDGAIVTPIAKDGNCLFESIAQGLCALDPDGTKVTGAEVRARIAVHFRKNEGA